MKDNQRVYTITKERDFIIAYVAYVEHLMGIYGPQQLIEREPSWRKQK